MERIDVAPDDINMRVADNVRAELARERWSGRKAAQALGVTPMYMSRRLSGETPMDANDIAMFARFLNVDPGEFFKEHPRPFAGAGRKKLLDLDSNQEPAG